MLAFPWISAWTHWGKRARWSCLRGWTCTWLYRRWRDFVFSPGIFMIFFSLYYSLPHSQVGSNATPKPFRDRRWSTFNRARCERIHLCPRRQSVLYVHLYRLPSLVFTQTAPPVSHQPDTSTASSRVYIYMSLRPASASPPSTTTTIHESKIFRRLARNISTEFPYKITRDTVD